MIRQNLTMNWSLVCSVLLSLLGLSLAGDFTVTDEAWFDFEVADLVAKGQPYVGRITIALFGEAAPMTVMNFLAITRGYDRGDLSMAYTGSIVHRVVPDFVIQMGDITNADGSGGRSIYGERFDDEDFILSHRSAGWVSMANHGPDTNNSQFFILLTKARWLDNKHVVFGKVIQGFEVLKTLGDVESDMSNNRPKKSIVITDCGTNYLDKKYDIPDDMLSAEEDM